MENIDKRKLLRIVVICAVLVAVILMAAALLRPESTSEKSAVSYSDAKIENNHFYKVYSDNFTADTDIPDSYNDKAEVLFAKLSDLDNQSVIKSVFFEGKNPTRKVRKDAGLTSIRYIDGENYFAVYDYSEENKMVYDELDMNYIDLPTDNFSTKHDQYKYPNRTPLYDTVYKQKSLDFMSPEKAVETAKDVLKKFSIEVTDDVEIYAMDYKTMQEYQDKVKREDPDTAVNYITKDTLTQDDEFYILSFTAMQNQLPMTHIVCHLPSGRSCIGSNIKVYLSKNGIFYFDVDGIYQIGEVAETPDKLITVEEAIEKAFDEYNSIVTTDKVTVTEVRFEYAPIPYNSNYNEAKLTPVWTLTLSGDDGSVTFTMINAVTGEIIN